MASFQTHQPIGVSIDVSQGTVHVIASDRTDTVVSVNPSDRDRQADVEAARKTLVDLASGILSIRAPKPRGIAGHLGWGRSGSVDLTVELPERSSLTASAGFADFRCDGRLGDVEVKTGAGNVRLDATGALRVHSGAGQVWLGEASGSAEIVTAGEMTIGIVAGDADVKNLNGDTWIGRVGGNVSVRSANGDVTIDDVKRDVTIKTANGDIRLGRVARGSVTLESGLGTIQIGIKEGTAAWVDASTKFGRLDSTLRPTDDPEQSTDTVQIHARTAFGDVLITRSGSQIDQGDM